MNKIHIISSLSILLLFSACSSSKSRYYYAGNSKPKSYSSSKSAYDDSISQHDYKYAKMNPYTVLGKRYYPRKVNVGDVFNGVASWYGPDFHAKATANGEQYNMHAMTAAHKTFPMNTVLRVTNNNNGKSAIVRVNDRGPFVGTRIIDLSNAAAKKVSMVGTGTAPVTLEVLGFYSKNKTRRRTTKITAPKVVNTKPKVVHATNASYSLQIASFTNIDGALKTQEKHDGVDGYKTVIKDIETDSGRFFKVYLRGFKSENEARNYKANSDFQNSFIIKENK